MKQLFFFPFFLTLLYTFSKLPRGHSSRLSYARHLQCLEEAQAPAHFTHLLLVPLKQIKWKPAYVVEIYRYQGSVF